MSIFGGARKGGGGHALPIVYMSLQVALANLTVKLSALVTLKLWSTEYSTPVTQPNNTFAQWI